MTLIPVCGCVCRCDVQCNTMSVPWQWIWNVIHSLRKLQSGLVEVQAKLSLVQAETVTAAQHFISFLGCLSAAVWGPATQNTYSLTCSTQTAWILECTPSLKTNNVLSEILVFGCGWKQTNKNLTLQWQKTFVSSCCSFFYKIITYWCNDTQFNHQWEAVPTEKIFISHSCNCSFTTQSV